MKPRRPSSGHQRELSPEQAAGQKLDGRSDLYSLGIVFYRMLTGDVPYDDTSAVSVGNQHLQSPIPMLPVHLAAFQDVVNRLLAKDPANRLQSGQEVARALEQVRAEGVVPDAVVKTDLITTAEIEAVAIPLIAPREQMRADRGDQTPRGRRRTAAIILAVLLFSIVGVMTYFVTTEPETVTALLARTGLTEDPALHEAWQAAEALREDPNQSLSTIVAAYRRVLDIEPTHEGARVGVDAVATQWKVDIDAALESDDLALADAKLTESLNLFPRDEALTVLFDRLADRRRADLLLASTQILLESQSLSHVPSATAAIQSYQEVLRLHPGDEQALAQLDRLAVHYGKLAAEAASAGNVSVAMNNLGRATTANPDFSGLASVREQISQAASLQAEIDGMLQQASALRADAALIDPPEANAAEIYHRVLATDPDNVIANQGLSEVAARVLTQFNAYLLSGEFERVQQLVDRSVAVGLGDTPITEMKNRYEAELARLDTVASLLIEASELIQNGFLTDPVDENAVARLREVIRLDPENSEAQILLENVAKRLASVAQEAFDVGLTVEARHYLDLALTVNPDVDRWRSLRDLWAEGR